jgi:hypothetical protein
VRTNIADLERISLERAAAVREPSLDEDRVILSPTLRAKVIKLVRQLLQEP